MQRILLAEDDQDFGSILKQYLEIHGYEVTWTKDGLEGLETFNTQTFDICVLDVMMPKMDGFSLAEKIVDINPETPFIFLTAKKMKEDKIKGLKLGADDYIVKPFEADILVLKLQNILKRAKGIKPKEISTTSVGAYNFDSKNHILKINEKVQRLTQKETVLIQYFLQHVNETVKREDVLNAVWGSDDFFSGRSMDVFISRLRKYFKEDPNIAIESIRGVGLIFKITI